MLKEELKKVVCDDLGNATNEELLSIVKQLHDLGASDLTIDFTEDGLDLGLFIDVHRYKTEEDVIEEFKDLDDVCDGCGLRLVSDGPYAILIQVSPATYDNNVAGMDIYYHKY